MKQLTRDNAIGKTTAAGYSRVNIDRMLVETDRVHPRTNTRVDLWWSGRSSTRDGICAGHRGCPDVGLDLRIAAEVAAAGQGGGACRWSVRVPTAAGDPDGAARPLKDLCEQTFPCSAGCCDWA
jgi:hypothetical protein